MNTRLMAIPRIPWERPDRETRHPRRRLAVVTTLATTAVIVTQVSALATGGRPTTTRDADGVELQQLD